MPENQATNEERGQAAEMRKRQSYARGLQKAGKVQANTGSGIRDVGSKIQDFGAQKIGEKVSDMERGVEKGGRVASLRSRILQKSIDEKSKGKSDEKDGAISSASKMGSGMLLKSAWIYLIPSCGATLLWINIHVFLSWIFPSMFCKLGDEWLPKIVKKSGASSTALRTGELILFLTIDIIFALIIFAVIAVIIKTVQALSTSNSIIDNILMGFSPVLVGIKHLITN